MRREKEEDEEKESDIGNEERIGGRDEEWNELEDQKDRRN